MHVVEVTHKHAFKVRPSTHGAYTHNIVVVMYVQCTFNVLSTQLSGNLSLKCSDKYSWNFS